MRSLYVVPKTPYPPDTGSRQRYWNVLRALRSISEVDVFIVGNTDDLSLKGLSSPDAHVGIGSARPSSLKKSPANIARWLRDGELPSTLWFRDLREVRNVLRTSMRPAYDLVWAASPIGFVLVRDLSLGPLIVERHDLEDALLRGRIEHDPALRRLDRRIRERYDITRWRRFTADTIRHAARVVVCSNDDAERVGGGDKVIVIPNGFDRPEPPAGSREAHTPPTLLFQGQMTYQPNADGAKYFVDQVLPQVLAEDPRPVQNRRKVR